jgi:hypothetical protein
MRISSLGWAVIVLAATVTLWNVLDSRTSWAFPPAYSYSVVNGMTVKWGDPEPWNQRAEYWIRRHAKTWQREVLIVGIAAAAFLVVNGREVRKRAP